MIHDYNGFNIWINSKKAATNVPANDGKWHHMAFTWKSVDGHWKVYKDGVKVKYSSEAFQKGEVSTCLFFVAVLFFSFNLFPLVSPPPILIPRGHCGQFPLSWP